MNTEFQKIYLNEKAYPFILEQLRLISSVSDMLTDLFADSKAKVWGFIPKGISETELTEFEYGGKFNDRPLKEVANIVNEELEKDQENSWMLVDNVGNTNYPPEKNVIEDITTVFYYDETVLHLYTKKPNSIESISKTISSSGAYPFIGFLTKITTSINEQIRNNNVEKESMEALVKKIFKLIVGVYDEEGYLIVEIE